MSSKGRIKAIMFVSSVLSQPDLNAYYERRNLTNYFSVRPNQKVESALTDVVQILDVLGDDTSDVAPGCTRVARHAP